MRLRLFILLLIPLSLKAASKDLFIVINPEECTGCIGSLKYIEQLKNDFNIKFILPSSYKNDSDLVISTLFLDRYTQDFIWSDSLYDHLSVSHGLSTVTFVSHGNAKKYLLKAFSEEKANYLQRIVRDTDTLIVTGPLLSSRIRFIAHNDNLLLFDQLKNKIMVYSLRENKEQYSIHLSDNIISKAFQCKFKDTTTYETNKEYYKDLSIPAPNKILCYYASGDSIYTISQHDYITLSGSDTLLPGFYALNLFDKGMHQYTALLEGSGLNSKDIIGPSSFGMVDGKLITNFLLDEQKYAAGSDKNFFLCSLQRIDATTYKFETQLPFSLPTVFSQYNYHYIKSLFWRNYACTSLKDNIYDLSDPKMIDANFFPENLGPVNNSIFNYRRGIYDFKIDDAYAYFIYWNGEEKLSHYAKVHLKDKSMIIDRKLTYNIKKVSDAKIDDFDYDYVLYPLNETTLLRMRMAE